MSTELEDIEDFDDESGDLEVIGNLVDFGKVGTEIELIFDGTAPFEEKIKAVEKYQSALASTLHKVLIQNSIPLKEVNSTVKNITLILKNITSSLYKKREMEAKDDIDFHHPKIQKGFAFFIESTLETMTEAGIDDEVKTNFINQLAVKLVGFEDRLNKELRTIASHMLDHTNNPLINKIRGES